MQGKLHQYHLRTDLAKKYSHTTYLASPTDDPEHQVVLIAFDPALSLAFPRERKSFLQKAQHIKELQHPYLLPILDIGSEEGQPFSVRDYLPNASLRSRLKKMSSDHLKLREALTIVSRVGQALAYAHEHQIFHGSIKPENILFDAHGQAFLADFYLVERNDAILRDQTTEEYAFCYMAPEQFTGSITEKSDQYSLGCLAYELITGHVPLAGQTLASIMGHQNSSQPLAPSERVAGLPPTLETAVLKALAKDPNERFYDLSLFLEAIQCVSLPSPTFPLVRATRSRINRAIPHPLQLPKEDSHPLNAQEQELEELELHDVSHYLPETMLLSEGPQSKLALVTPLSCSENGDSLQSTPFVEEEVHVDTAVQQHQDAAALTSRVHTNVSQIHNIQTALTLTSGGRRKTRGQALLLSVIVALGTSVLWIAGIFALAGGLHPPQKIIQAVTKEVENTPRAQSSAGAISIPITRYITSTPSPQPLPSPPVPTVAIKSSTSYEADAPNNTRDGTKVFSCNLCFDGFRVGWISYDIFLQFNDVKASYDGNYSLKIYYLNSITNRQTSAFVSVDGGPNVTVPGIQILTVNCCDNAPSQVTQMTIHLHTGNNTIKISNPTGYAPDIDRIVVG